MIGELSQNARVDQ